MAAIEGRIDTGLTELDADITSLAADIRALATTATVLHEDTKSVKEDVKTIKERRFNFVLWIIRTALAVFLGVMTVATFGKDMFEWGTAVRESREPAASSTPQGAGERR